MDEDEGLSRSSEGGKSEEGGVQRGGCEGVDSYRTIDRNRAEDICGMHNGQNMGGTRSSDT